jgi:integrase
VQHRITIGKWPTWTALLAVKEARELRRAVDRGEDPLDARTRAATASEFTFKAITDNYLKREGHRLRSLAERRRVLERLVYPRIGSKPVDQIKRSDITHLLDRIESENGAPTAGQALAFVRRVLNWHATRTDDYISPIVRGMGRDASDARQRILSDEELRAIWTAEGTWPPAYRALVRFLLLTGARRAEAAEMPRSELKDGTWVLRAARNKVEVDLARPLSAAALAALPPVDGELVFGRSLSGGNFSLFKRRLDEASGVTGWRLHDLRRTARSLMSRAGVLVDHAEHCLGHVKTGVRGVYDTWQYQPEMRAAYERLAGLVARIVEPVDNVTVLHAR